ncbi:MAG TPA: hypothetical protein VHI31_01175 [Actinomycetota bacterium]|nr:hypothetical protein [Actinomycetota bacterium]
MNPSLAAHLDRMPGDSADRMFQSWQVAWNGHALVSQPLDFFDSNIYWPLENTVAFSDALIGFSPAGLIGSGSDAALIRYNLLFLFTYASAFFAAALLARELGAGWAAAVVAGAAFAFAPWRLAHHNHLHVLASAPLALCLFLLLRGYRRHRAGLIFGGFIAATWQVSIGFTLGLQVAYLLGFLALLWGIYWWRTRPRPEVPRRVLVATVAGMAVLGIWSGLQALPFLEVVEEHPEVRRDVEIVKFYSPPARSLLIAPPESLVWGEPTAARRQTVAWAPEMALFPGLTVLLLAMVGLGVGVLPRSWRIGLAVGVAGSAVLALGYSFVGGSLTYGLLHKMPGWESVRTPGRLFTITSLLLALLAGAGAQGLVAAARGRREHAGWGRLVLALAVPAVVTLALLAEGRGRPAGDLVEPPLRRFPASEPQMHLPSDDFDDVLYMFWSIDGFPEIVNGYSGFTPKLQLGLRQELAAFPDPTSVERLRDLGVRTVVVHTDRTAGTQWDGAELRPVDGLPLRRSEDGNMVIFELEPGSMEAGAR